MDRRQPHLRWSAVFGGAAIGVGTWLLLTVLGMGVGLRADDAGMATGAWALVASLVAMFAGGLVAGHLASTTDGRQGALHGAVTWAIGTIVGIATLATTVAHLRGDVADHHANMAHGDYYYDEEFDRMGDGQRAIAEREAHDKASKAMLLGGSTMLLSLAAAIGGGILATRRKWRNEDLDTRTTERITHVGPPPAPTTTT